MDAAVPTSLGSSCFLGSSLTGWKEWSGRELKAELWIYQPIYVPAITFDHELWVSDRKNSILDKSGGSEAHLKAWAHLIR